MKKLNKHNRYCQNLEMIYYFYLLIFKILIIYKIYIYNVICPTSEPWIDNFFCSMVDSILKTLDLTNLAISWLGMLVIHIGLLDFTYLWAWVSFSMHEPIWRLWQSSWIYDVQRAKFKGRMECLEGVFKGMERRKRGRTTHFSWEAFLKKLKLNFFYK